MSQPKWRAVAQLGDVNPLDSGGYWVFVDETGEYAPEAELLEVPDSDDGEYVAYRFILENCTYINGILSDNQFHPEKPAWFAGTKRERKERPQDSTYLKNIADFIGMTVNELAKQFRSGDPIERAQAWRAVGEYHGFLNLDEYPLTMTRREARLRYRRAQYRVK